MTTLALPMPGGQSPMSPRSQILPYLSPTGTPTA
jgi:hypothetical protein